MTIDHIFIFTDDQGKIADELVDFGLREGSSRIHNGQGTRNRKFYFENFYLEVLWVYDENEIHSEATKETGLWQRADYKRQHCSPFGLCLVNSEDTDELFANALSYQPEYFTKGMTIDILKNDSRPDLPWTFRLPFKGPQTFDHEPRSHRNGMEVLTRALFEHRHAADCEFIEAFKAEEQIQFKKSSENRLTLIFDHARQGKIKTIPSLQLTLAY